MVFANYYKVNQKPIIRITETGSNETIIGADIPDGIPYRVIHPFANGTVAINTESILEAFIEQYAKDNPLVVSHEEWFAAHPEDEPEVLING
jgi:hypothetical protein